MPSFRTKLCWGGSGGGRKLRLCFLWLQFCFSSFALAIKIFERTPARIVLF